MPRNPNPTLPTPIGFAVGQRIELHPATDLWMRGARYGTIVKIGRKLLHIRVEALNRTVKVAPGNINKVIGLALAVLLACTAPAMARGSGGHGYSHGGGHHGWAHTRR